MSFLSPDDIEVIAPNFKKRLSGVTATVVRLVPIQAQQIAIAAAAPLLPDEVPQIRLRDLIFMSRSGPKGARIWLARRNTEMLAGVILKHIFRKKLRLLFTSASQRHHTGYSRFLIRQMDAVIATSAKSARYLECPSSVIHHGIDLAQFKPIEERTALRQRLGLPDGFLIGCYGRIRAQKGTGDFLDAVMPLLTQNPDAHAVIMGRATAKYESYLSQLKEAVGAAGLSAQVHFMPEVPVHEMAAWYQGLDLFVAPQRWEGFGLTPLEAMACQIPVIATRVGAFEELIRPGETGVLIDAKDIDAMRQSIADYLAKPDQLAQQGQAARLDMEQRFDLRREASSINAIYHQLQLESAQQAS